MTVRATPRTPWGANLRLGVALQESAFAASRLKRAWRAGNLTDWPGLWYDYLVCCQEVAEAQAGVLLMACGIGLDSVVAAEVDAAVKRFPKGA